MCWQSLLSNLLHSSAFLALETQILIVQKINHSAEESGTCFGGVQPTTTWRQWQNCPPWEQGQYVSDPPSPGPLGAKGNVCRYKFVPTESWMLASVTEGRWDGGGWAFSTAWMDLELLMLGECPRGWSYLILFTFSQLIGFKFCFILWTQLSLSTLRDENCSLILLPWQ